MNAQILTEGKSVRDHQLVRKCPAAVLAVLLSVFLATAAYAQDKVADDEWLGGVKFYVKGVEGKVPGDK